jgi:hypothetical protein
MDQTRSGWLKTRWRTFSLTNSLSLQLTYLFLKRVTAMMNKQEMYRKHNELLYQQYTDTKPTPTFKTKDAI